MERFHAISVSLEEKGWSGTTGHAFSLERELLAGAEQLVQPPLGDWRGGCFQVRSGPPALFTYRGANLLLQAP